MAVVRATACVVAAVVTVVVVIVCMGVGVLHKAASIRLARAW
jgi:hypothetical protein